MLDDGLGFRLVPWKPVIEPWLGKNLSAFVRTGGVSWDVGHHRGALPSVEGLLRKQPVVEKRLGQAIATTLFARPRRELLFYPDLIDEYFSSG
jgi:hypothetical protein